MNAMTITPTKKTTPILLFDGECSVCRHIASWVRSSSRTRSRGATLVVQPIGDDPAALRALSPKLNIWDAYETIHVVMPDGSLKRGGQAVAEVLRRLPATRWFAWVFAVGAFRFRPFQWLLDAAYTVLADVRPLFGCESCGTPSRWVRAVRWLFHWPPLSADAAHRRPVPPHFSFRARSSTAPTPSTP